LINAARHRKKKQCAKEHASAVSMQPLDQSVTDIVSDSEGTRVVDEGSAGPVDISHYDYYEGDHDDVGIARDVADPRQRECIICYYLRSS
jgi:hypothetical protein